VLAILFAMTGSLLLPVKALAMNVLTISAAFGVLVLVFRDGRLEGLLDYTRQSAIESTQPLVLLAIVFGLLTDYGVFLLARIKEHHDAGASNEEAVALGLERTGRMSPPGRCCSRSRSVPSPPRASSSSSRSASARPSRSSSMRRSSARCLCPPW
jgi:uncharacterized membrane protein YdfJ with MMPL/SSD domain